MVLTTGQTTTTWMLPVLANTSLSGGDVTAAVKNLLVSQQNSPANWFQKRHRLHESCRAGEPAWTFNRAEFCLQSILRDKTYCLRVLEVRVGMATAGWVLSLSGVMLRQRDWKWVVMFFALP
jgi:hypothetical protein